jgi:FMN phosphatase YigB (HAD superfamily)
MQLALFDLDDTLIDRRASFRSWAQSFSDDHGLNGALGLLEQLDNHGLTPRSEFFASVASRFSIREKPELLLTEYRERFPGFVPRPSERAFELLAHLRAVHVRVGVVTNGSSMQLRTLEAAGLSDFVDACCVSDLEGIRKPDTEIFKRAARRCGVLLEGGWMVGDNPAADIRGAHDAGLWSIWLRHGRTWNHSTFSPTQSVDTLEEALEMLIDSGDTARA